MALNNINIQTETPLTGNVKPILHEIHHGLNELVEHNQRKMIDLHSLPLAPAEYTELEDFLSTGEIDITLNVLGTTRVRESGYPGVWRVEHFDDNDRRIGYFIEIGHTPEILRSQCDDIKEGLAAMAAILEMEEENEDETA